MKSTHKPGYVSSSCNNGILRHGCHTTHSLTVSTQVIHLNPPKKMLVSLALLSSQLFRTNMQLCIAVHGTCRTPFSERVNSVFLVLSIAICTTGSVGQNDIKA